MAQPSTSLASLRSDLGGSLMEFDLVADRAGYIATKVFPVFEAATSVGQYGRIPIEQLLQNSETERSPGGTYSRGNFTFDKLTFATEEHGHEEPVDDREAKLYLDFFDAELIAAARAQSKVLINQEKRVANMVFNTTTFTGSDLYTDITTAWLKANYSSAIPIDDVQDAADKVYANSGLFANALICNRFVFRNLKRCDQVIDSLVAQGAGDRATLQDLSAEQVAMALGLDMVLVAGGSRNTAKEGQNASISQIWSSSYAMVARICTTNDIQEPGLGRIIHWGEDGSNPEGLVESYRDETVRSDIIRYRHDVDEVLHYVQCGHLLKVD
jgi:hypothetical protein